MAKILIADDEQVVVEMLVPWLKKAGHYEVAVAIDGEECLNSVRTEKPDLILLDIMMPKINGLDIIARLKADAATRSIPIIVSTAGTALDSREKIAASGAEDYILKPFDAKVLLDKIAALLGK